MRERKPRILIVDDQDYVRLDIIEELRARGDHFEIIMASNSIDALDKFHNLFPDLVLLDLNMPDKRGLRTRFAGLELLSEFKDHAPLIPVIIMTGFSDNVLNEEARIRGCYAFLIKGKSPLLQTVNEALTEVGFFVDFSKDLKSKIDDIKISIRQHMSHVPTGYYHLLQTNVDPLISFEVANLTSSRLEFRAVSEIIRYSDPMINQFMVEPQQTVIIPQLPSLVPAEISTINELINATLHTEITNLENGKSWENTNNVKLHARNTALLAVFDGSHNTWRDMSRYLAAWVTPNNPNIQRFLGKVKALHPKKSLVGYQGANTTKDRMVVVREQIRAIYEALQDDGLGYVNTVINFGLEPEKALQRIRLPSESLEMKSDNCIDGTVLFASLMMAISLDPILVLIPGHAFVGWETWDNSGDFECLETTLVGKGSFDIALRVGNEQYQSCLRNGDHKRSIGDSKGFLIQIELKKTLKDGLFPMS